MPIGRRAEQYAVHNHIPQVQNLLHRHQHTSLIDQVKSL
jgi:hypothetical protein